MLTARGTGDLKTRYRPQKLDELIETFNVERLKKILANTTKTISNVYMFHGPTGCGKTTAARIFARALICESKNADRPCLECDKCQQMQTCGDYLEINIADFRKIDDIRSLLDEMKYMPTYLSKRIYVLDEVHQLLSASQEILLKALEEAPDHIMVILCTTSTAGLKKTLIDRTLPIKFGELTYKHAKSVIEQISKDYNKTFSEATVEHLIDNSHRSVRALLNSIQSLIEGELSVDQNTDEGEETKLAFKLSELLVRKDWVGAANVLKEDYIRKQPEAIRIIVTSTLRAKLLNATSADDIVKYATPLGLLENSLPSDPVIEAYNQLVLRCSRACYSRKK